MFVQADTTQGRSVGGLGIGLMLVRTFVEMHGGTVSGESAGPGQGSRFTVRLPLLPRDDARPLAPGDQAVGSAARATVPRKIIVVDDNADVAESLALWLGDCGHDVRVTSTGQLRCGRRRTSRPRSC